MYVCCTQGLRIIARVCVCVRAYACVCALARALVCVFVCVLVCVRWSKHRISERMQSNIFRSAAKIKFRIFNRPFFSSFVSNFPYLSSYLQYSHLEWNVWSHFCNLFNKLEMKKESTTKPVLSSIKTLLIFNGCVYIVSVGFFFLTYLVE